MMSKKRQMNFPNGGDADKFPFPHHRKPPALEKRLRGFLGDIFFCIPNTPIKKTNPHPRPHISIRSIIPDTKARPRQDQGKTKTRPRRDDHDRRGEIGVRVHHEGGLRSSCYNCRRTDTSVSICALSQYQLPARTQENPCTLQSLADIKAGGKKAARDPSQGALQEQSGTDSP